MILRSMRSRTSSIRSRSMTCTASDTAVVIRERSRRSSRPNSRCGRIRHSAAHAAPRRRIGAIIRSPRAGGFVWRMNRPMCWRSQAASFGIVRSSLASDSPASASAMQPRFAWKNSRLSRRACASALRGSRIDRRLWVKPSKNLRNSNSLGGGSIDSGSGETVPSMGDATERLVSNTTSIPGSAGWCRSRTYRNEITEGTETRSNGENLRFCSISVPPFLRV